VGKETLYFSHIGINPEHTEISFIPKAFSHKFFIRVKEPFELIEILCCIDENKALYGIYNELLDMCKCIDVIKGGIMLGQLTVIAGCAFTSTEYMKAFNEVPLNDKKHIRKLYEKTRDKSQWESF